LATLLALSCLCTAYVLSSTHDALARDDARQTEPSKADSSERQATSEVGNTDSKSSHTSSASANSTLNKPQSSLVRNAEDTLTSELPDPAAQPGALALAAETPLTEVAAEWSGRFETLLNEMNSVGFDVEKFDRFYAELATESLAYRSKLKKAVSRLSGTFRNDTDAGRRNGEITEIQRLHDTVNQLYRIRVDLMPQISSDLLQRVTGTGLTGMRELRAELAHLVLYSRVQVTLSPNAISEWVERFRSAPLPVIERLALLIFVVIAFRQWRRWAPGFLRSFRNSLANARPRRRYKLRVARLVWYFDQVRKPLEWISFSAAAFRLVEYREFEILEQTLSSIAQWVLLAWLTISVINAIAIRGGAGLSGETADLRMRSLRLIAAWIVLLGLGLDLTETYLGQATTYAFVWLQFKLLAIPLLLVLIAMWRTEIFLQLANERQIPQWIDRAIRHRRGLKSFASSAVGGAYLIVIRLQGQFFRATSTLDWGRRFQATLYQRDLTRKAARRNLPEGKPIGEALKAHLLRGDGESLPNVYANETNLMLSMANDSNAGMVVIVGERGGGKTMFLQSLAAKFEDGVVMLDCLFGGFDEFHLALANVLGLSQADPTPADFQNRAQESGVRIIAIDNLHRLSRPHKGGFHDMNRIAAFVRQLDLQVLWVPTIDSAAWGYIRRSRINRIPLLDEVHLSPWTEDQIGNLIDLRCREAGIAPDYGELMLPQQMETADFETTSEYNRAGFLRLVWHAAGGNPAVALRLWADSLAVVDDDRIVVRFIEQNKTNELEGLSLAGLLVLRVIAQVDRAAVDDIVESLRFKRSEVGNAISVALRKGWIEKSDDRYRISWNWYRPITTVLTRRNLLSRPTKGGIL